MWSNNRLERRIDDIEKRLKKVEQAATMGVAEGGHMYDAYTPSTYTVNVNTVLKLLLIKLGYKFKWPPVDSPVGELTKDTNKNER